MIALDVPPASDTAAAPWDSARAYSYMIHVGVLIAFRGDLANLWAKWRAWWLSRWERPYRLLDRAMDEDLKRWPIRA